ncbi:uncharacterized protein LOC108738823 [Agrilus planipennis]|uniref:Uncharacterized protein LOC108738823 n=1 Tax=Agrilus planipennis TaxID=224129 RepID=A0A1W4X520_AGRPL|nr:uncharacterized protein LOC108738823 [Agrilus planipennis]
MGLASKEAWMSLFTEPVASTWTTEIPELRKIAMIITAYQQELNRLKYIANGQLHQLEMEFKKIEEYKKKTSLKSMSDQQFIPEGNIKFFDFNNDRIPYECKENLDPNRTKTICMVESKDLQSPDIFNVDSDNEDFNFFKMQIDDKEIGSLESSSETPVSGSVSPKINKSAKQLIRAKIPKLRGPNTAKNTSQSLLDMPKEAKNFFSGYDDYQNYINDSSFPKITINMDLEGKKLNTADNSIIDGTPDINASLRRTKRLKSNTLSTHLLTKNKQNNKTLKKITLTQMFKDTMEGDESFKFCEKNIQSTEKVKNDETNISKGVEMKEQSNKDQYASFIEDYMRIPFKKSPSPKHAYQMETVRGKARQNLKGWSCKDCKKYYEALDLPEEELKEKMNKCSRHRSKFKPMNDTPVGYWDLTFPPTQPTM